MTTINGCGAEIEEKVKKGFAYKVVTHECGIDDYLCDECKKKLYNHSDYIKRLLGGDDFPNGF